MQGSDLDKEKKASISKLDESCDTFKINAPTPRRFKLTVGAYGLRFNEEVQIDSILLQNRPVLHMVHNTTQFCSAALLQSQSTQKIWKIILSQWISVYSGPPDYLAVDQGSGFISRKIHQNTEDAGIKQREAPIKTSGAMGTVQRYHGHLRSVDDKIRREMTREFSDKKCLSMEVFAKNATVVPESLCTTLLVFGVIPSPARKTPSATRIDRAEMIEKR